VLPFLRWLVTTPSHCWGPASILGKWNWWWTKWLLDTGTSFPPTLIFLCQYHSTNAPHVMYHWQCILAVVSIVK
jgi:hypothetical protein